MPSEATSCEATLMHEDEKHVAYRTGEGGEWSPAPAATTASNSQKELGEALVSLAHTVDISRRRTWLCGSVPDGPPEVGKALNDESTHAETTKNVKKNPPKDKNTVADGKYSSEEKTPATMVKTLPLVRNLRGANAKIAPADAPVRPHRERQPQRSLFAAAAAFTRRANAPKVDFANDAYSIRRQHRNKFKGVGNRVLLLQKTGMLAPCKTGTRRPSLSALMALSAAGKQGVLVKTTERKEVRRLERAGAKVRFDLTLHDSDEAVEWWERSIALNGRVGTLWASCRTALYTYTVFRYPFRMAFGFGHPGDMGDYTWDLVPDAFFLADIAMNHFLEYKDDATGAIVGDLREVRRRYRKVDTSMLTSAAPNLWLDILSIVPMHLFTDLRAPEAVLHVATIPRVQRILKLLNWFKRMEVDIYSDYRLIALFKFSLMLIGAAHWVGCIWFLMARTRDFGPTTWIAQYDFLQHGPHVGEADDLDSPTKYHHAQKKWHNYQISLFYGFYSMTAFGYPTTPTNDAECVYTILLCIAQLVYNAYILGTLFHYVVKNDQNMENFRRRMNGIESHAEDRKLPSDLVGRMKRYMSFVAARVDASQEHILAQMPPTLVAKIARWQHLKLVETTSIFNGVPEQYLTMLLVKLRSRYLEPGEILFKMGDMSKELCFIQSGAVDEFEDPGCRRHIRSISHGIVGELAFFVGIVQPAVVAASLGTDVVLQSITKEEYEEITDAYSEGHSITLSNIMTQLGLDDTVDGVDGGPDDANHAHRKLSSGQNKKKGHHDVAEVNQYREKVNAAIAITLKRQKDDELSAMIDAASEGDIDTIRKIIHKGFDVNTGDYDARTMLHLASAEGNLRVVRVLLDEGADVSVEDRWGQQPLHDAVRGDHQQVAQLLAANGATLTYDDPASVLCNLVSEEDFDGLKNNITYGTPINSSDYDGRTALHLAASDGNHNFIAWLLQSKIDVNASDRWGNTPLVDAVQNLHELPAKILFEAGGEMHHAYASALLCDAALKGNRVYLQLLHECGTDVRAFDYDRRTALHLASAEGQLVSVDFLLGAKAEINFEDRWGGTAIDDALRGGHYEVARLLQASGAKSRHELTFEQECKLEAVDLAAVRERIRIKVQAQEGARRKRQQIRDGIKLCLRDFAGTKDHLVKHLETLTRVTAAVTRKGGHEMLVLSMQEANNPVGKATFQVPEPGELAVLTFANGNLQQSRGSMSSASIHDEDRHEQEIAEAREKAGRSFAMRRFLGLPDLPLDPDASPPTSFQVPAEWAADDSQHQQTARSSFAAVVGKPVDSEDVDAKRRGADMKANLSTVGTKGGGRMFPLVAVLKAKAKAQKAMILVRQRRLAENAASDSDGDGASSGDSDASSHSKTIANVKPAISARIRGSVLSRQMSFGKLSGMSPQQMEELGLGADVSDDTDSDSEDEDDEDVIEVEEAARIMQLQRNTLKNSGKAQDEQAQLRALQQQTAHKFFNFNQVILLFPTVERGFAMLHAKFKDFYRMQKNKKPIRPGFAPANSGHFGMDMSTHSEYYADDAAGCALSKEQMFRFLRSLNILVSMQELSVMFAVEMDANSSRPLEAATMDFIQLVSSPTFLELLNNAASDVGKIDFVGTRNPGASRGAVQDSVMLVVSLRNNYQIIDAAYDMLDRSGRGQLTMQSLKSAVGGELKYGDELINLFAGLSVITKVDFLICLLRWLSIIDDNDAENLFTADDAEEEEEKRKRSTADTGHLDALHPAARTIGAQRAKQREREAADDPDANGLSRNHPDTFYAELRARSPALAATMRTTGRLVSEGGRGGSVLGELILAFAGSAAYAQTSLPPEAGILHKLRVTCSEVRHAVRFLVRYWRKGCHSPEDWLASRCSFENVEYVFHDLDADDSGVLDFPEFEAFVDRVSRDIKLPRYKVHQLYYRISQRETDEGGPGRERQGIDLEAFCSIWRDYYEGPRGSGALGAHAARAGPAATQRGSTHSLAWLPQTATIFPGSAVDVGFLRLSIVVAGYYVVSVPYHIAFYKDTLDLKSRVLVPMFVADGLLWIAIGRRFFTAYTNRRSVVEKNLDKCRRQYFKTDFPYDLISAAPLDLFVFVSSGRLSVAVWVRATRFLRLRDVIRYLLSKRQALGRIRSELYILFTSLAVILHVLACAWTVITTRRTDSRTYQMMGGLEWDKYGSMARGRGRLQVDQYIFSLYWVCAGLTGVGTGALNPSTHAERWFGVVMMLGNLSLLAYLLGTISSLFMSADEQVVAMRSEIAAANAFIEQRQLPPELEGEVRSCSYFQANSKAASDLDFNDIFRSLSYTLQVEVARHISRQLLVNSVCFQACSDNFIDTLSTMLTETTHPPGTMLFRKSDIARVLFLVSTGRVELLLEDVQTANHHKGGGSASDGMKSGAPNGRRGGKKGHGDGSSSHESSSSPSRGVPGSRSLAVKHAPDEAHVDEVIEAGHPVLPIPFFFGLRQTCGARTATSQFCRTFNLERESYKRLVKLYPSEEDNISHNLLDVDFDVNDGASEAGKSSAPSGVGSEASGQSSNAKYSSHDSDTEISGLEDEDNKSDASNGSRYSRLSGAEMNNAMDSIHKAILKARSKKEKEAVAACCMAAAEGKLEELRNLLGQSRGTRVSAGDYDKRTPLHLAASNGHASIVRWLLDKGADVTTRDRFNNTPMHDAMRHKHDAVIGILRDAGASLDLEPADAASLLCMAAYKGDKKEIIRLVDNHVNPNVGDYDGRTALHLAACSGHTEIIKYLLLRHADVNARDRTGGTPLADAIRSHQTEAQKLLKAHGGLINHDDDAASELCRIASEGDLEELKVLVANGIDVNLGDYDSRRALHLACCEGRLGMVEYLLGCDGIDVNVVDRFGGTPLEDAIREGHEPITIILRKRGGVRSGDPSLTERKEKIQAQAMQRRTERQTAEREADREIEQVSQSSEILLSVLSPLAHINKHLLSLMKALHLNISGRTCRSRKAIEAAKHPDVDDAVSPVFLPAFKKFMKVEEHATQVLDCYVACRGFRERPTYATLEDIHSHFFAENQIDIAPSDHALITGALADALTSNGPSEPMAELLGNMEAELHRRLAPHVRRFRNSTVFRSAINSRVGRLWRVLGLCHKLHTKTTEFDEVVAAKLMQVTAFDSVKHIFGDRNDHVQNLVNTLSDQKDKVAVLRKSLVDLAIGQRVIYKRAVEQDALMHAHAWDHSGENGHDVAAQRGPVAHTEGVQHLEAKGHTDRRPSFQHIDDVESSHHAGGVPERHRSLELEATELAGGRRPSFPENRSREPSPTPTPTESQRNIFHQTCFSL